MDTGAYVYISNQYFIEQIEISFRPRVLNTKRDSGWRSEETEDHLWEYSSMQRSNGEGVGATIVIGRNPGGVIIWKARVKHVLGREWFNVK